MRFVMLIALAAACGPLPEEPATTMPPAGWLESNGPLVPWLSVNGEHVPGAGPADWLPTGVAFDARAEGWRISCLPVGRKYPVLRFEQLGGGALQLRCVLEEEAPGL